MPGTCHADEADFYKRSSAHAMEAAGPEAASLTMPSGRVFDLDCWGPFVGYACLTAAAREAFFLTFFPLLLPSDEQRLMMKACVLHAVDAMLAVPATGTPRIVEECFIELIRDNSAFRIAGTLMNPHSS